MQLYGDKGYFYLFLWQTAVKIIGFFKYQQSGTAGEKDLISMTD